MTTLKFTSAKIDQTDEGLRLSVLLDKSDIQLARKFVMEQKEKLYDMEIKEHREKRSLDANALYWMMAGKLAKAIGDTPENIYRRHIRDIGNFETLCMKTEAVPAFIRHWKSNHLGRFVETKESKIPSCTTVLAYYGSSDFSIKEMSMLIDNCIQDCKAAGVDTTPPEKISLLLEEWGK